MNGTQGTSSPAKGTTGTTVALDPIFVSVVDAAAALALSRREIYRLMDDGELESVERGKRRLIVVESLYAYVERLRKEAAERRKGAAA